MIVFSSDYNANSQRTELPASIGGVNDFINTYDYNALGRLNWVKQAGNTVADKRVDFTYDAASRYDTII